MSSKNIERRQYPIPVTAKERDFLEEQKQKYEALVGRRISWGEFLKDMCKWAFISDYRSARKIERAIKWKNNAFTYGSGQANQSNQ